MEATDPASRYVLLVDSPTSQRSTALRWLLASFRAALHVVTEGYSDRHTSYITVYDIQRDEPVARWDWGESTAAAMQSVQELQEELDSLGVDVFCQKYHLERIGPNS